MSERRAEDERDKTCYTDKPICPYCGEPDPMDELGEVWAEGEHSLWCGSCGRDYIVNTDVSHYFTTLRAEEDWRLEAANSAAAVK